MVYLGPQFHNRKNKFEVTDPKTGETKTQLLHYPLAPIFHGSPNTELKVGDILDSEGPHSSEREGFVYGTNNERWARMYAEKASTKGQVYRVAPVGKMDTYVDEDVTKGFADPRGGGIHGTVEHRAPRWRVIGRE
jgi:hypothetical protein